MEDNHDILGITALLPAFVWISKYHSSEKNKNCSLMKES